MEHWALIFFEKITLKHLWILLGTLLGIFGILKKKKFLKIFEDWTFHGKLGKNFPKKFPQNMFKTRLDTFGNTFGHFWNFENIFFENFRKLDPPRNTGQKNFSKKLPQNTFKTRLDSFGNDFGHFWNFENFLIFLKFFEVSTLHGTLGKKNFEKFAPKHVQNTFGYFWQQFWEFLEF